MTAISPTAESARENARTTTGQFGAQEHSAPENALLSTPEPLIVVDENGEDLWFLQEALQEPELPIYSAYAASNGDGTVDICVSAPNNFLWDAELHFSEPDDDLDGSTAEERQEQWLDDNRGVVEEVFREWFNADIYSDDGWDNAAVDIVTTVRDDRMTESLIVSDVSSSLAKFINETDPGTYGSPYVMDEIRRRVEERNA